jgi:hypothetical protein
MSGTSVPHHAENQQQKRVGIIIAVIAVVMSIVAALANYEANHMIVKEVQSSNGFAWYQFKRQRSYMNELELKRIEVDLNGTPTDAQRKLLQDAMAKLKTKNAEYEKETDEIRSKAEEDKGDADAAAHRHHRFEYSEILLNIAVVLCSLTLLTEAKVFFRMGMLATLAGLLLAVWTLLQKPHYETHSATAPAHAAKTLIRRSSCCYRTYS